MSLLSNKATLYFHTRRLSLKHAQDGHLWLRVTW